MTEQLVPSPQAARMLGVEPQTLRVWRLLGKGPRYCRLSDNARGRAAYRVEDLEEWLRARTFGSTSEEAARAAEAGGDP